MLVLVVLSVHLYLLDLSFSHSNSDDLETYPTTTTGRAIGTVIVAQMTPPKLGSKLGPTLLLAELMKADN